MGKRRVLGVDVGGSHVKVLVSAAADERRRFVSGPGLGPKEMVIGVKELTADWAYDAVSIGVPSPVHAGRVLGRTTTLSSALSVSGTRRRRDGPGLTGGV
jgi:predicted NBD/HSP70 family sugar kinase